jgi:toxin FitB
MAIIQYLCDTNIISELSKRESNPGVMEWASSVKKCALSVVTLEEIHYGLAWHPNNRVREWIKNFLQKYTEILPVTNSIAEQAGTIRGQFQSQGIVRTQADMLIAATASLHSLTLVTRNTRDFNGCRIAILNPFR